MGHTSGGVLTPLRISTLPSKEVKVLSLSHRAKGSFTAGAGVEAGASPRAAATGAGVSGVTCASNWRPKLRTAASRAREVSSTRVASWRP
eukprot:scaffold8845_cov120-Isochrysis_galbana.AAC.3